MDYKSNNQKLDRKINELSSRVLKMSDEIREKPVSYDDFSIVVQAVIEIKREINSKA